MTKLWQPKEQWLPVTPEVTSSPGKRSPQRCIEVIRQFKVPTHQRYTAVPPAPAVSPTATEPGRPSRAGKTYCSTFMWDVSRAMGCEIPHWVGPTGDAVSVGKGEEHNINKSIEWLLQHGPRFAFAMVTEQIARGAAGRGEFAIATWKNMGGGSGHVVVLEPPLAGESPLVTWCSQAGRTNFEHQPIVKGFGNLGPLVFFAHL